MFSFLQQIVNYSTNAYTTLVTIPQKCAIISQKSATAFLQINGFLFSLSYLLHITHQAFITGYNSGSSSSSSILHTLPIYLCTTLACNGALVAFIHFGSISKPDICKHKVSTTTTTTDWLFFLSSSCIQGTTHCAIMHYYPVTSPTWFFPAYLFLFEVIFDLAHYIGHRSSHTFYYRFHKVHHRFPHPTVINTYCQHPIDLLLVESLPLFALFYLFPKVFSIYQVQLVMTYKNYIEIAGHVGKHVPKTSSFPLFIWLPRWLGIELYSDDHDRHHSHNNCNYAKRFSLWDKVFGTYIPEKTPL